MFSLKCKIFLNVLVILSLSGSIAVAQIVSKDSTSKNGSAARISLTIIKDTLSNRKDTTTVVNDSLSIHSDTLLNRQDTSAVRKDTLAVRKDTLDIITSESNYNTVPGFRVQLMSTQNLLQAISAKAMADTLLSGYNVYIVYDSPYYKVRAGDFHARYEANRALSYIADHGFPDAWSVPDNVFKNPARKK